MHRYYQPWLDAQGSSVNVADHVQDLAQVDDFAINTLSDKGFRALSSRDKTLTAFAQLAALRLNVRRAMVSLLDSSHQYILAEATRTLSLVDDTRHAQHDELWLGNAVVARDDAVCQCAFTRQYTVNDDNGHPVTATAAVMPDCRLDKDYKDKPYVVQEPGVRFYAGVPIRSRSGHNIGVYAVSHDAPRDPLTYDELRFMQDIAVAVMDHLEWARDRVDRYKGERIVRGMADFIEGAPAMRPTKKEDISTSSLVSPDAVIDPPSRTKKDSPKQSQPKRTDSTKSTTRPGLNSRAQSYFKPNTAKPDSMSRLFDRASRILRESTLAEGTCASVYISRAKHNFCLLDCRVLFNPLQASTESLLSWLSAGICSTLDTTLHLDSYNLGVSLSRDLSGCRDREMVPYRNPSLLRGSRYGCQSAR